MEHKKITYKGKTYTTNMKYEFSDDGEVWCEGILKNITDGIYAFNVESVAWKYCRESQAEQYLLGTIEYAPVEIIEGQAYMFDFGGSKDLVGVACICMQFDSCETIFHLPHGHKCYALYATNIRPLTYNGDR